MDSEYFVEVIKLVVRDAAVKGTIANLTRPSGRKPTQELVDISKWFNAMDDEGKNNIEKIVKYAADESVFGFLAVLDGVRQIENTYSKGELELFFVKDGKRFQLSPTAGDFLHDLFD